MVTRTQIDRLSSRIDALAAHAGCNPSVDRTMGDPRVELRRRLQVIAERMGAAAEERGEPFPPQLPREERDEIIRARGLGQNDAWLDLAAISEIWR
jgi:hypothetical protein